VVPECHGKCEKKREGSRGEKNGREQSTVSLLQSNIWKEKKGKKRKGLKGGGGGRG